MKILRNYKIHTKLLSGFIVVLFFVTFIGIRDLLTMQKLKENKAETIMYMHNIEQLKEIQFLIQKEVHNSLGIAGSDNTQDLKNLWREHSEDQKIVMQMIDSVKNFTKNIEKLEYKKNRNKILNTLKDIQDDDYEIILSNIKSIHNQRKDFLENPFDTESNIFDNEEDGGIIFTDEDTNQEQTSEEKKDTSTEDTETLDDSNQPQTKNTENTDQQDTVPETPPENNDSFNSFNAVESSDFVIEEDSIEDIAPEPMNPEILFETEDNFKDLKADKEKITKKRINDSYGYVNASKYEVIKKLKTCEIHFNKIIRQLNVEDDEILKQSKEKSLFLIVICFIISLLISIIIASSISLPLKQIQNFIQSLGKGELPEQLAVNTKDEIGRMTTGLNYLVKGLRKTSDFSLEIEKGNFDSKFEPLSKNDVLGNSLIDMRKSLKLAKQEEEKRKIEDHQLNWTTEGLAQFSEILRQNSGDMNVLADNIINNLVKYMNVNQGGFFVYEDKNVDDVYLNLIATYAYDKKKYLEKKIRLGEGLIGMCALEKYTIYLTDVPDEYIEIESGLGYSNPKCILITPLKIEEEILGVIELASFNEFAKHEIELIERIAESVASTLSTIKINARTANLLEQSRSHAIEMEESDEKMRQTIEMLQATQEEGVKQEKKLRKDLEDSKAEAELLKKQTAILEQKIKQLKSDLKKRDIDEIIDNDI